MVWKGKKARIVNCPEAVIYKDKIWTMRSEPWNLCGTQVVLLEGIAGGFDINCLEIVEL